MQGESDMIAIPLVMNSPYFWLREKGRRELVVRKIERYVCGNVEGGVSLVPRLVRGLETRLGGRGGEGMWG